MGGFVGWVFLLGLGVGNGFLRQHPFILAWTLGATALFGYVTVQIWRHRDDDPELSDPWA